VTSDTVEFRRDGGVAWLTLNRPEAANAINAEMVDALRELATRLAADETCSVVVFEANGRLFCGGGDVASVYKADDPVESIGYLADNLHAAVDILTKSHLIVVAAVQGTCAGGGFSLVLNADLVVATTKSKFLAAYTAIGLSPDTGMSYLLPRVVGPRRAAELFYLGKVIDGATALDWGIVNELVDDEQLSHRAAEIAKAIESGPAPALRQTKRLLRDGASRGYTEHLADEAEAIRLTLSTPESRELLGAFVNKTR
jgi:2-(1,2-epoxy-1,2-dihydrophenyl)acetyl-CoA isomerase